MAMVIFVPAGFVFVLCMEPMFEDLMRADRQKQRQTVEVMQLVMLLFLVPFALIPREYRCLDFTCFSTGLLLAGMYVCLVRFLTRQTRQSSTPPVDG